MAKSFNLTAELNLRGPANLKKVVSDIRRQLGAVQANVNVNFSANAIKNSTALNKTLKDLNGTLRNTVSAATKSSQAINNLSKTFATFGSVTGSASSVNNLSKSVSQLSSASTSVTPQIKAARTEMQEFGRQSALAIRRFAAFTTVTSVVFGLTRSITQGVEAFIDFDKELTKIQAVTGETKAGLSDLVASITTLSTGLGVSSKDLTNVSLTLAQAGFSASDTAKALKALALTDLAPTFDNLSQTVEGSIALLRQFNINAGDLEKALGSINEVSAKFAVESSDIIAAIQRAGGVFATASKGVSEGTDALNEFVAVFTSVRATTRESAETIATGLRTIFTRIQRGKTIEALKEFGVELTDAEGKFVGAFKAVQLLSEGLNKIDPRDIKFSQIVEELGGFRQIGKVIPLIQQLAVTQEALKVAQQGQDSLAADAVIAQTSLANQIAKTREQFLALFRDIGTTDTFQNITRGALGLASALISVADSIKGILPILAIIGSIKGISALTQFTSGFVGGLRSTGKADGGRIYGFNKGGVVPGSGKGDKVPAMLEPGEVVMSNNAVNKYGRGNLVRMNKYVGGGKVNITAQELKGRSRSSKAVENLITDDKDRVLYGSGRAINTLDNISFNRRIYKLYDEDSINNWSGFEEAVQKRVGGTRTNIGKNDPTFPIDIIGSNLGPLEVRNRSESTSNRTLLDKLIRYYISKPDFSKLQNRPTPDDISLGNIGVVYNSAKYDPPNAKELMTGGKIQKFMAGSPGGIRVASGKGRGAEGPRGARSKFKTLSETELAQLSTKDLIAYAKRQARDIFTTGGAGMAIASEFVEVPPERIIPELESELTTYLGKKGFWREKIAPFGSSPRARAGTERKMDSRTLRRMAATAGGVDVSALEGVSTESLLKYAEQAPRAPKEVLEKTIARYSNVSSIKPKFQEWGKNPSGGVFADVVSGFEDQIRNELEEPNKSRFDSLIKAGSLDSYKAMGGKDGHIPPLKKAIYEITGVTEKNIGGLIQKLNIGGKVQNFVNGSIGGVAAQALDPMLEKLIQDIANIGGTTDLYKFVSKPEIDDILSSKRLSPQPLAKDIVSSKWLRKQTPDRYGDRAQYAPALEEIVKRAKERFNEQQSGIQAQILRNLQASEGQAYQFGLASIYGPNGELGYSSVSNAQEIEGNNNQKYLTQIVRKSLPTRYESAIQATREDIAGLSQRAGERLQYTDIFGTGGPLAFDFDETLVKNADIFNEAGKIDILAYNNLDRVKEALKNAELTLLGQELQKRLIQYPELMDNIRVLTARPQSNAPFLANKLNQLGLSISESQITGVSGGLNKVNNLSDLETLIDDNIENIQSVLAGGKKGILYQESKRSDPANLSAQRGLAATEGYTLEDMVRNKIGIDINDDNDPLKPIDFPKGLGAYASMWDMPPTIPTDTKRTNSSTASSVMFDRAKKFYIDNFASGGFASGGTVPAMVSNGEAFVPPETAKKIGYAKLDKMNMADRNGMRGFSSGGGISVFKGSGSGTSDSIGPIGLPEGSYVIREKATKALGLKRGGAVKSFFFGGRSKKKDAVDETFEAIESFSPVSTQASKALDQAIESLLAKIVKNIADADPTISFDDALARAQRDTAAGSPGSANFALKQAAEAGDQSAAKAVANAQRQQVNAIIKEIRSIDKAVSISDAKAAAEKRVADAWGGLWKATNNATQATNKAAQAAGAAGASGSGASGSSDKSIESGIARFGKKLGDNTTLIFSSILPAIVGLYTKNIDVAASKSSATFAAALEGAVTGFSSSIALGGQLTSTVAGFSSDESTQNTINAFGGITSVVLGFGAAIAQSIISFKNAAIEFEKADAKKKLDVALDSVSKSFDELSKDIKNIDLQDAIIKKLQEAGDEAQRILTIQATTVRGSFATLLSGDLLGSGGPEAAQRSTILERSGTFAYIQSFNDEIRKVQFASLIPQIAAENSKLFAEVASNTNRIIEEKLRSGSSFDELIGSDNFKALARNIANADAEIQARILSIQSGDLSEQDKRARIESIQTIYAESEIRKRAAIIEAEKRVKEAEKSANLFSRSLERIFQNMEQSIGRTNFELDRMKESLDLVTASLTGQAKAGNSAITALNILANPRAYSEAERSSARTQASSLFVGNRNILTGLLTLGDNIEGRVLATINQVLRDNPAEANNEVIAAGIERAVRKDLADLQLPPDVSSKIANQVREGLVQLRKSEDEKIDFTDLVEKIPSLSKVVDSAKRAQEAAIKALESWQNSLNNYSSAINQLIDLQIETNNRLRQANKLLINSQIDLAKTLGKDISIATLTRARDVDIASRTGGATDPTAIFNRILQLENRRRGLQSAVDATANIGPSAVATKNFIQLNQSLKNNNVALRESYAALKELADNGELASAALNKVQEAQQKTAARANFLEKLVTSTPEELNNLNNAFFRLQRNLSGQTNSIQNSIGAQKAYFEALNNGSSAFEAIQAAQQAFVNERKETLDVFNQILPFLGQGQQANEMRANVLQSMLAESGFAMTPMFQDMINAIRNPEADPETKAAIEEYRKVVGLQSEANKLLGLLNTRLAIDIADKSAATLTDALSKLKFTFETTELADIRANVIEIRKLLAGDKPVAAVPRATGGIIYASAGRAIDFSPRGTDTVPAMLTPGEFVVNKRSTQQNLPLLQSINSGNYNNGGKVKYYSRGGYVSTIENDKALDSLTLTKDEILDLDTLKNIYPLSVYKPNNTLALLGTSYSRPAGNKPQDGSISSFLIGSGPSIKLDQNGAFKYDTSNSNNTFNDTDPDYRAISNNFLTGKRLEKRVADSAEYKNAYNQAVRKFPSQNINFLNASADNNRKDKASFWNPNIDGFGLLVNNTKNPILPDDSDYYTKDDTDKIFGITRRNWQDAYGVGMGSAAVAGGAILAKIGLATGWTGVGLGLVGAGAATAGLGAAQVARNYKGSELYANLLSKKEEGLSKEKIPLSKDYKTYPLIGSSSFSWLQKQEDISKFKDNEEKNRKLLNLTTEHIKKPDYSGISPEDENIYNEYQNVLRKLLTGSPYENFPVYDKIFDKILNRNKLEAIMDSRNIKTLYAINTKYNAELKNRINDIYAGDIPKDLSFKESGLKVTSPKLANFGLLSNYDPAVLLSNIDIVGQKEDFQEGVAQAFGISQNIDTLSGNLKAGKYNVPYQIAYTNYKGKRFDKNTNELIQAEDINVALLGVGKAENSDIFNQTSIPIGLPISYAFDSKEDIKQEMEKLNKAPIAAYIDAVANNNLTPDISDKLNSLSIGPPLTLRKNKDANAILGIPDGLDIFESKTEAGPFGTSFSISKWIKTASQKAIDNTIEDARQAATQVGAFGADSALEQNQFRSLLSNLLDGSVKLFQGKPGLPGLGKNWLGSFNNIRNSLKRSRSSIDLETLKQYSSQASNIFGFVTGQAQNVLSGLTNNTSGSQNNIADFIQELGILTSGASSAFGILSSGRTGFLDSLISGNTISGSLEDLFRTLGFNRVWTGIQGTKLEEGYKKSLENQLQGSRIRTVDSSGKITTKDFSETDLLSDTQSVVDIAFNPYNEFPKNNIRQNLINDVLSYVNSAVDKNGRKLFNNTTANFLKNNISPLASRYLTQDLLFDVGANQEAKNRALNNLKTQQPDYEHKILGFQDKFGPLPDASYFEKRLLVDPQKLSSGGTVYASNGTLVNYQPKGTDTVPAMLTPGEFVINRSATQKNLPLLQSINSGNYSGGGVVYARSGALIGPTDNITRNTIARNTLLGIQKFDNKINNIDKRTINIDKKLNKIEQSNTFSSGGIVYASNGTLVPYQPRGTDTVPAMLTPGEFVINRSATQRNLPLLQSINSGNYSSGGVVYAQDGKKIPNNTKMPSNDQLQASESIQSMMNQQLNYDQIYSLINDNIFDKGVKRAMLFEAYQKIYAKKLTATIQKRLDDFDRMGALAFAVPAASNSRERFPAELLRLEDNIQRSQNIPFDMPFDAIGIYQERANQINKLQEEILKEDFGNRNIESGIAGFLKGILPTLGFFGGAALAGPTVVGSIPAGIAGSIAAANLQEMILQTFVPQINDYMNNLASQNKLASVVGGAASSVVVPSGLAATARNFPKLSPAIEKGIGNTGKLTWNTSSAGFGAALDASLQYAYSGEIDPYQLVINSISSGFVQGRRTPSVMAQPKISQEATQKSLQDRIATLPSLKPRNPQGLDPLGLGPAPKDSQELIAWHKARIEKEFERYMNEPMYPGATSKRGDDEFTRAFYENKKNESLKVADLIAKSDEFALQLRQRNKKEFSFKQSSFGLSENAVMSYDQIVSMIEAMSPESLKSLTGSASLLGRGYNSAAWGLNESLALLTNSNIADPSSLLDRNFRIQLKKSPKAELESQFGGSVAGIFDDNNNYIAAIIARVSGIATSGVDSISPGIIKGSKALDLLSLIDSYDENVFIKLFSDQLKLAENKYGAGLADSKLFNIVFGKNRIVPIDIGASGRDIGDIPPGWPTGQPFQGKSDLKSVILSDRWLRTMEAQLIGPSGTLDRSIEDLLTTNPKAFLDKLSDFEYFPYELDPRSNSDVILGGSARAAYGKIQQRILERIRSAHGKVQKTYSSSAKSPAGEDLYKLGYGLQSSKEELLEVILAAQQNFQSGKPATLQNLSVLTDILRADPSLSSLLTDLQKRGVISAKKQGESAILGKPDNVKSINDIIKQRSQGSSTDELGRLLGYGEDARAVFKIFRDSQWQQESSVFKDLLSDYGGPSTWVSAQINSGRTMADIKKQLLEIVSNKTQTQSQAVGTSSIREILSSVSGDVTNDRARRSINEILGGDTKLTDNLDIILAQQGIDSTQLKFLSSGLESLVFSYGNEVIKIGGAVRPTPLPLVNPITADIPIPGSSSLRLSREAKLITDGVTNKDVQDMFDRIWKEYSLSWQDAGVRQMGFHPETRQPLIFDGSFSPIDRTKPPRKVEPSRIPGVTRSDPLPLPPPIGRQDGGIVYASEGKYVNFQPKGTDTVPAMLTPGEFVVNRAATQKNLPLLKSINNGTTPYKKGGTVYANSGGLIGEGKVILDDYFNQIIADAANKWYIVNKDINEIFRTDGSTRVLDFKDSFPFFSRKGDRPDILNTTGLATLDGVDRNSALLDAKNKYSNLINDKNNRLYSAEVFWQKMIASERNRIKKTRSSEFSTIFSLYNREIDLRPNLFETINPNLFSNDGAETAAPPPGFINYLQDPNKTKKILEDLTNRSNWLELIIRNNDAAENILLNPPQETGDITIANAKNIAAKFAQINKDAAISEQLAITGLIQSRNEFTGLGANLLDNYGSKNFFSFDDPVILDSYKAITQAKQYKKGGVVYASKGKLIPYQPKGTDTVPAMLTPGEFVVNKEATKDNLGLLQNINKGGVVYARTGGMPGLTSQQEAGLENRRRLEEEKRRRREEIQSRRETYRYSQTLPVRERKEFMTNQQANASSFNNMVAPPQQNNIAQQQGIAPQQPLPDLQAQILASLVQLNTTATTISNNLNSTNQNITTPGISQNTTAENNNPSGAITISPEANEFLTQLTSSINNFGSYIDKLSGVFPESMEMNINFGELVVRIEGAAGLESLGNRVRDDVLSIVNNKISNMETLLNNLTGGEAPPPR